MKFRRTAAVILAACGILLLVDCGGSYERAINTAVKSDPNAAAFESLYPGSYHFISYFTGVKGPTTWNSKALIHGRYVLTMQFPVSIKYSGRHVNATAPPAFVLVEVDQVTTSPSGQTSISYNANSQRSLA